jgi:uncharacterized protein (TIGR00369 family)
MAQDRDAEKLKQKLRDFAQTFPFFQLLGFEVLDFGPGFSKTRITVRDDLKNPNGVIHGGVIATLIDAGITQAMLMTDAYQEIRDTKGMMTTLDLRVKYLRPLSAGNLTCSAEVPRIGKRIAHASALVTGDDGKEIAMGDSMLMLMAGK